MYDLFYNMEVKMLLTMKQIQDLILRDRNQRAIAEKTGLSQPTINRIAGNKNIENTVFLDTTRQKLSNYFIKEFDYAKQVIFGLRGE